MLNVKDMMVEDVSLDDSPLRDAPVLVARVRCGKGALRCSRCGRKAPRYDSGGGGRSWRHQDFGCLRVELSGPVPRVECRLRGVVVSRVPWAEPGGRFTRDFGSGCAWLMTVAGQKTVSGFLHIAWRAAGDIARRVAGRLESSMPCMFDGLRAIGVDGTGRRKGRAYITVIVDHGRGRVIWAHDGHGRQVPGLFFRQLTPGRRASIRIVTGDGAGRIDSSVAEHRPNAERVLDSFHIVSWMTDALDRVGKRLWNQARRDGNTTATEAMRGVEYAVPGNPGDLTERQSTALATLADADPKGRLYRSWQLRELRVCKITGWKLLDLWLLRIRVDCRFQPEI
ncbi:transposase [Bifidobacterium pullorum]|uniref:transposase n=1 Tax=Bifidobacterium pullorum TaxID=78448 RepID=UPI0024AE5872|nr:transposase [Bifidobacterium pullorum]